MNRIKDFQPVVGDTWIADETVLKAGGKKIWFFDVIDEKTRYLLASRLATSRTIKEAALVMKEAKKVAGKSPKRIITDVRFYSYLPLSVLKLIPNSSNRHNYAYQPYKRSKLSYHLLRKKQLSLPPPCNI